MYLEVVRDLMAALCFGALIGLERQWKQRFTGISTHALVDGRFIVAIAFSSAPESARTPTWPNLP